MPVPPSLELGDFEGKELLVTEMKQGGGPAQGNKGRKRGSKGSARRAAKQRLKVQSKLKYDEVKRMMESRSKPNEEVSLREYEEEMEDMPAELLRKAQTAGVKAEEAYKKKLEKWKVPLYGTLKTNVKREDSIRVMSVNPNGLTMSKRGNSKADRLRQVMHKYQLDAVGIQEVHVNWDEYKSSNRLASLLRRGYDPIRSVESYNKHKTTNIGKI